MDFTRAELAYKKHYETTISESKSSIGSWIVECANRGVLISSQFEGRFIIILKDTTENLIESCLQEHLIDYVNAKKSPNKLDAKNFLEATLKKELQRINEQFLIPQINQKCIERINDRLMEIVRNSIRNLDEKISERVELAVLNAE